MDLDALYIRAQSPTSRLALRDFDKKRQGLNPVSPATSVSS
jgi:hypothetical protein